MCVVWVWVCVCASANVCGHAKESELVSCIGHSSLQESKTNNKKGFFPHQVKGDDSIGELLYLHLAPVQNTAGYIDLYGVPSTWSTVHLSKGSSQKKV